MDGGKPAPRSWALAASAGSSMIGLVVVGIALDIQYQWAPWGTLIGLVLGFFSCIGILIAAAQESKRPPAK
jgi:F0F1-type ATP synthase assembly protein I